jgi:hypothetical protein
MKDSSLYGRVFKNEAEALAAHQRHMDERDMFAPNIKRMKDLL